jgi:hypothetical protein
MLTTYALARPFAERHLYRRTDAHDPLFRMGRGQGDARSMGLERTPRVRDRLVGLVCDSKSGMGQDRGVLGGREEEECVVRPGAIDVDTKIC